MCLECSSLPCPHGHFPQSRTCLRSAFLKTYSTLSPFKTAAPTLPLPLSCSFPQVKNHLFVYYVLDSLPVFIVISCRSSFRRPGLRSGFTDMFRACTEPCTKCKVNKYVLSEWWSQRRFWGRRSLLHCYILSSGPRKRYIIPSVQKENIYHFREPTSLNPKHRMLW